MTLKNQLCFLSLFLSFTAYSQQSKGDKPTDTIQTVIYNDSNAAEPVEMNTQDAAMWMDSMAAVQEMIGMEATPAVYEEFNIYNKFKYNSKIKMEEKPDKKASYSLGSGELLKQFAMHLTVPYNYKNENKYVILKFVVGKDSLLYNPEILYSPGTEYSINATAVIEKLQERFLPATKNGKPVDTVIIIPIRFDQNSTQGYPFNRRYH